jgi:site-specific DNA-methyltransferase (adenine-specific)
MALRFAGFELTDCLSWNYATGFPKSLNISKAVDALVSTGQSHSIALKQANDDLRTGGERWRPDTQQQKGGGIVGAEMVEGRVIRDEAATEEGAQWAGDGTALKPSNEPILLARKALEGTYAENVLKWGTGALNIDGCRVGGAFCTQEEWNKKGSTGGLTDHIGQISQSMKDAYAQGKVPAPQGRWPANTVLTHHEECGEKCHNDCPCKILNDQGEARNGAGHARETVAGGSYEASSYDMGQPRAMNRFGDSEGASRFFYSGKAARSERWVYCRNCKQVFQRGTGGMKDHAGHAMTMHPTQKPLDLMKWLVRLVTPPGGIVLDPFCGTGSTAVAAKLEGFHFITCDLSPEYAKIADARLANAASASPETQRRGSYFCPGCKAKGEVKLISKEVVERMREEGKKITCMKCMKRISPDEFLQG